MVPEEAERAIARLLEARVSPSRIETYLRARNVPGDWATRHIERQVAESRERPPRDGAARNADTGSSDLGSLTKRELQGRASELDIYGRSNMTKAQLLDAVRTAKR